METIVVLMRIVFRLFAIVGALLDILFTILGICAASLILYLFAGLAWWLSGVCLVAVSAYCYDRWNTARRGEAR